MPPMINDELLADNNQQATKQPLQKTPVEHTVAKASPHVVPGIHDWGSVPIVGTPYSFKVLTSKADLETIYAMRFDVFCLEKGIADPDCHPNKLEMDEYDKNSIHTALLENGEIVAYTRLVLPCDKFPSERNISFPPDAFARTTTVETSRTFVIKDKRSSDIVWHLFNSIYSYCQENELTHILTFSNSLMYNGLNKRRAPISYSGNPVTYHGHKTYPMVIDIIRGERDFTQKTSHAVH